MESIDTVKNVNGLSAGSNIFIDQGLPVELDQMNIKVLVRSLVLGINSFVNVVQTVGPVGCDIAHSLKVGAIRIKIRVIEMCIE